VMDTRKDRVPRVTLGHFLVPLHVSQQCVIGTAPGAARPPDTVLGLLTRARVSAAATAYSPTSG
jgi:hypothetical protein